MSNSKKYWKLKYYLSRGKHFRYWQIRGNNKEELYFHPEQFSLKLYNCILTNNVNIATKTYNGANRQPCAWVKCDSWEQIKPILVLKEYQPIYYNPKIHPHWRNAQGNNIDNQKFNSVITISNKIFADGKTKEYRQISLF